MWILRPCNWKHFCDDPDEHHAVCMGLFFPVFMWFPIARWNVGEAARLLASEPWYVAFGMTLRVLGFIGILIGVFA